MRRRCEAKGGRVFLPFVTTIRLRKTEVFSDAANSEQRNAQDLNDSDTGSFYFGDEPVTNPGSTRREVGTGKASVDPVPSANDSARAASDVVALLSQVGRYAELQVVGRGSFGTVLKAVDQVLGRFVAIKILREDPPQGYDVCFQTEARRLAALKHPGICQVFDFGVQGGRPYFVTEWLDGQSLAELEKPVEWRQACGWVADIAEAMSYAHRQEVVHRDLKPANIMIDDAGDIRVIDFGLALDNSEHLQSRQDYGGSPAYMAPEQVGGQVHLFDARVDVWAMGVILYELLTGNRPFRGPRSSDVLIKIQSKPAAPLRTFCPEIPDQVEQIVLACLAKRPDDRVATSADLAGQLRAAITAAEATGNGAAAKQRSPANARRTPGPQASGRSRASLPV